MDVRTPATIRPVECLAGGVKNTDDVFVMTVGITKTTDVARPSMVVGTVTTCRESFSEMIIPSGCSRRKDAERQREIDALVW